MHLHLQTCLSKGYGSAHPQPYASADAADFFPLSGSGRDAFIKQSGLSIHPPNHQDPLPDSPCSTQFTIVTCCCSFKQNIVGEEKKSLSLTSPTNYDLEDISHRQQLHRDTNCARLRLPPSPTSEVGFPSWSSGLHICVSTSACKHRCCTRSHLGKRIFLAARRTLARFGVRQRRRVQLKSTSAESMEYRCQSSTEQFLRHDSTSKVELQGHLRHEADSGTTWELSAREIDHAPRELPAEVSRERFVPHEPVSILNSSVPTVAPLPHFSPPSVPALGRPMLQASISMLDTSFPHVHCPRPASESQDPPDETINVDLKGSGSEEHGADHTRSLFGSVEQGTASEATAENRYSPVREVNHLAGRAEFCESPTSISREMELKNLGQRVNPWATTIPAFNQSSVLAGRQASCSPNGYTLEIPLDLNPHRQSCHGMLNLQTPDLQLFSPPDQNSAPSESSSCDRSASIHDCLCLQRLNLLRGPSSSEFLAILNHQSGKLEGWMPYDLHERMEVAFEFTAERSLRKLNELENPDFRGVVELVSSIKPTLDSGFSAQKSLVSGQVPNELNGVMSLLFIAYSIVTMFVDEQSQARFAEGLFLDAIEWTNAINCGEEQDAFKMLLQYVWLPAALNSGCTHDHRWSSHVWRSFRPARSPFERTSPLFEEGWLGYETESGFRLRTGLNAQICQWYVDYFHRAGSLHRHHEPYSPASYWVETPPSFEESVRCDVLRPWTEHPFSDACNRALDTLRHELDSGQVSTFDEVASVVNSEMSKLAPELARSSTVTSALCRGAQAMYNSRKVSWLLRGIRRAANHIVSPGGRGDVEASHPPPAIAGTHRLHELNRQPNAPSLPMGDSTASTTPPATSPIKKRKRRTIRKDSSDNEVSQITKCPHCEQTFSGIANDQKSNLNRHVEHKHPHLCQASTRVCPECGQGDFGRSDYLLNHRRVHYNLH